jgi:hypothetical protein
MRSLLVSLAACSLLGTGALAMAAESGGPVAASTKPDAELTLQGGSIAAGIGFTWGRGELKYGEQSRPFTIKGVSVVDVGASDFSASGVVYNLQNVADFSGNYVAAGAGIAVAGGGTAVYLKNEHGVVIKLFATDVGLKFKLSADGVHVVLKG